MFWFALQIVYVFTAWIVCLRSVYAVGVLAGQAEGLRRLNWKFPKNSQEQQQWSQLASVLPEGALRRLAQECSEETDEELLEDHWWHGVEMGVASPVLLRGLAMCSGMLGLLVTIVRLVGAEGPGVSSAMSSAVLGLVGALPCWSALALCVGEQRALRSRLLRSMRREAES